MVVSFSLQLMAEALTESLLQVAPIMTTKQHSILFCINGDRAD